MSGSLQGLASVLVLGGGPDAEREVSLESASAVASALREAGHKVYEHTIDRPTVAELGAMPGDVIFPVLHGPWGEGGPLQTLLAADGRGYVGSESSAAQAAMDKVRTKAIAADLDVQAPEGREVLREGDATGLGVPAVVKPSADGSSVGLFICHDEAALASAEAHALERGGFLAERFVQGRELTQPLLDTGSGLGPLCGVEIVPAEGVYDYEAKYSRDDTGYVLDPDLPTGIASLMAERSVRLCEAMGVRDLARIDFMLDDGGLWLLEVNTLPGFTSHSLLPKAALRDGLGMAELCSGLVRLAAGRSALADSDG